jgi:hypothetical protein
MTNSPIDKTTPPKEPTAKPATASPTLAADPGAVLLESETERRREEEEIIARGERELYGGGHISAKIPTWLLVVYAVMILWALYYAYTYWGGLGPGLDYAI